MQRHGVTCDFAKLCLFDKQIGNLKRITHCLLWILLASKTCAPNESWFFSGWKTTWSLHVKSTSGAMFFCFFPIQFRLSGSLLGNRIFYQSKIAGLNVDDPQGFRFFQMDRSIQCPRIKHEASLMFMIKISDKDMQPTCVFFWAPFPNKHGATSNMPSPDKQWCWTVLSYTTLKEPLIWPWCFDKYILE